MTLSEALMIQGIVLVFAAAVLAVTVGVMHDDGLRSRGTATYRALKIALIGVAILAVASLIASAYVGII